MCKGNGDGHHHHANGHDHGHAHGEEERTARVRVDRAVLDKNDRLADYNRGWLAGRGGLAPELVRLPRGGETNLPGLAGRGVLALNLVSSPGAGKTTLLERTVRDLAGEFPVSVIEGDQETDHDA